jgi:hypothetical protein
MASKIVQFAFGWSVVLLVMLLFSVPFVSPGTPEFVAMGLGFAVLSVNLLVLSGIIYFEWDPTERILDHVE